MTTSAAEARKIMDNLLKAKSETRLLSSDLRLVESQTSRVLSIIGQLGRGDVTGLIAQLTTLGPYGIALGLAIGGMAIGYTIYHEITKEKPTELYFWRYPE